jgi:hypothetical protein
MNGCFRNNEFKISTVETIKNPIIININTKAFFVTEEQIAFKLILIKNNGNHIIYKRKEN